MRLENLLRSVDLVMFAVQAAATHRHNSSTPLTEQSGHLIASNASMPSSRPQTLGG